MSRSTPALRFRRGSAAARVVPTVPGLQVAGVDQSVHSASSAGSVVKVWSASVRARPAARIAAPRRVGSARRASSAASSGESKYRELDARLVVERDVLAVHELECTDATGLEGAHREPVLVAVDVEGGAGPGHHAVARRAVDVAARRDGRAAQSPRAEPVDGVARPVAPVGADGEPVSWSAEQCLAAG